MKFEYEKKIKVTTLDIKWDLYWVMEEDEPEWGKRLNNANEALTIAAKSALEQRKPNIFYRVAEIYAHLGAVDTEPRWQFAKLYAEAYGEDVY